MCQAVKLETDTLIALKIVHCADPTQAGAHAALQTEIKWLTRKLKHPNIISAHCSEDLWQNYLIMEMEMGLETLNDF